MVLTFIEKDMDGKNLLILAEPGMGKTTFALNFYLEVSDKHPLVLIPLNLANSDEMIDATPGKNKTTLLLDGLDEDVKALGNPLERLIQLLEKAGEYKKVIITSTIRFIPAHKFVAKQKGYEAIVSGNEHSSRIYRLKRLYMPQLSLTRAQKQLEYLLPFWKNSTKRKIINYIQSNSSGITPFTLNYLPHMLPKNEITLSKNLVYEHIIDFGMDQEHHWQDKQKLYLFLRRLSADLVLNKVSRGEERIHKEALGEKAKAWGITPKPFQKDINALINHSPSDHLKFTHRSVMEYLFVQQLLSGDKSCGQVALTFGMKEFIFESIEKGQTKKLTSELDWLSGFSLKIQGLKLKSNTDQASSSSIFRAILKKNSQYGFLSRLPKLFKNPFFSEFGWDPLLLKNLKLAVFKSKSSFMKQKKTRWHVLINAQKVEITKPGKMLKQIAIKQNIFEEYANLEENDLFITFCRTVGLEGLRAINTINQSGRIAVLPDLVNFKKFTLFFWRK